MTYYLKILSKQNKESALNFPQYEQPKFLHIYSKSNLNKMQKALFLAKERNEDCEMKYKAIIIKIKNTTENTNTTPKNQQHNDHS